MFIVERERRRTSGQFSSYEHHIFLKIIEIVHDKFWKFRRFLTYYCVIHLSLSLSLSLEFPNFEICLPLPLRFIHTLCTRNPEWEEEGGGGERKRCFFFVIDSSYIVEREGKEEREECVCVCVCWHHIICVYVCVCRIVQQQHFLFSHSSRNSSKL
jgi:hypothetical protein